MKKNISFSVNKLLILFSILFLIFGFILFPMYQNQINELGLIEVQILDLRFGYTAQEVRLYFEQIGQNGKDIYLKLNMVDMFYPLIYGVLLILILIKLLKLVSDKYYFIAAIPLSVITVDYVENTFIRYFLKNQFQTYHKLVNYSSYFTQAKWILVTLIFALILVLVAFILIKKTKQAQ